MKKFDKNIFICISFGARVFSSYRECMIFSIKKIECDDEFMNLKPYYNREQDSNLLQIRMPKIFFFCKSFEEINFKKYDFFLFDAIMISFLTITEKVKIEWSSK